MTSDRPLVPDGAAVAPIEGGVAPEAVVPEAVVSEAAAPEAVVSEVGMPEAGVPEMVGDAVAVVDVEPRTARRVTRRQVLKLGAVALPSLVGGALLFERLSAIANAGTPADVDPIVATYDAAAHRWGFVVDATSCIGCGLCVVACKQENGVPLDEEHTRTWVERHVVTADGTVHVDAPEAGMLGFPPPESPGLPTGGAITASYFVPRLCMQCENSPCTSVCPVGATYRTPDGVILVDEERCIGCGYCVVACPYGARYLVPAGGRTPTGTAGVADKCTFCYHRIVRGQQPACVEVCPVGARKFGDLNDATSAVSTIVRERSTRVLRPDLGTKPRVHYVGLDGEVA